MTREPRSTLELRSTGAPPLDDILGGGIPARSVVVVAGEPGSGKTVLSLQMLFHAARRGQRSVYFTTLSEPAPKIIQYMQLFDFFDAQLLHEHIVLADLGTSIRSGVDAVFAAIQAKLEEHEPAFVAIDSFRALVDLLGGQDERRAFIYDLACHTAGWGATSLLVGEYTRQDVAVRAEFAIADGVILLGSEREDLTSVRGLEVLKMRGVGYSSGRHFFDLGPAGVSVYPRVSAPTATRAIDIDLAVRTPTGVAGLDDALGGGVPVRSATVVLGGTGTGKTLLGLHFLLDGVRRGEHGILFTLEETPEQLRAVGRAVGLDIAGAERAGLLRIVYTSPVELSTDRFLHEARDAVRAHGARRAVFDSLTTMELGVPSPRRYKELIYAIAKHLRSDGVTLLMTAESEQLLGTANLAGGGVSFVADNLIQLRYVELEGRLERAIAVIKARGIRHATEARMLTIGSDGMMVSADRFKALRGVLTGLPQRTQEPA